MAFFIYQDWKTEKYKDLIASGAVKYMPFFNAFSRKVIRSSNNMTSAFGSTC
jgi:hypothetical protein